MTPFLGEFSDGTVCLVVGFVWADHEAAAIVVRPDRSIEYQPLHYLKLHKMNTQMPDIFEWPEPVPA